MIALWTWLSKRDFCKFPSETKFILADRHPGVDSFFTGIPQSREPWFWPVMLSHCVIELKVCCLLSIHPNIHTKNPLRILSTVLESGVSFFCSLKNSVVYFEKIAHDRQCIYLYDNCSKRFVHLISARSSHLKLSNAWIKHLKSKVACRNTHMRFRIHFQKHASVTRNCWMKFAECLFFQNWRTRLRNRINPGATIVSYILFQATAAFWSNRKVSVLTNHLTIKIRVHASVTATAIDF